MNQLLITLTRTHRLPDPEPLPEIMEPPRQAWLAGLVCGGCLGGVICTALTVLFLEAVGRLS